MLNQQLINILRKYQNRAGRNLPRDYLRRFEKKMLYRTTKTENPQTTMRMVNKVLNKLAARMS